jgi:hypothetical protein
MWPHNRPHRVYEVLVNGPVSRVFAVAATSFDDAATKVRDLQQCSIRDIRSVTCVTCTPGGPITYQQPVKFI